MDIAKKFYAIFFGGLWGFWMGNASFRYVLDHSAGSDESPVTLLFLIVPFFIVSFIIGRLAFKFSGKKIVLALLVAIPILGPYFVPILSIEGANAWYFNTAVKRNDESYCRNIGLNYPRTECFSSIAKSKGDLRICDHINFDEPKYRCYYDLALQTNDVNVCGLIPLDTGGYNFKDECYKKLAQKNKDPNLCEEASDKQLCRMYVTSNTLGLRMDYAIKKCRADGGAYDGLCYYGEARDTKNPGLCDYIQHPYLQYTKNFCLQQFAK